VTVYYHSPPDVSCRKIQRTLSAENEIFFIQREPQLIDVLKASIFLPELNLHTSLHRLSDETPCNSGDIWVEGTGPWKRTKARDYGPLNDDKQIDTDN
jgi:hypothetical protein